MTSKIRTIDNRDMAEVERSLEARIEAFAAAFLIGLWGASPFTSWLASHIIVRWGVLIVTW